MEVGEGVRALGRCRDPRTVIAFGKVFSAHDPLSSYLSTCVIVRPLLQRHLMPLSRKQMAGPLVSERSEIILIIPGTLSSGSCRFFIYFRPAKNAKFCGVTCYVPTPACDWLVRFVILFVTGFVTSCNVADRKQNALWPR